MMGQFKPQQSTCISCHKLPPLAGGLSKKGCLLSRGELTQAESPSPSLLLGTELGGAGVDPPALLLLSAPPVMEQDVAVCSGELLALLLQATSEQSPLLQCPAGQPSSSRYGCGRTAAASPTGLVSAGAHQ